MSEDNFAAHITPAAREALRVEESMKASKDFHRRDEAAKWLAQEKESKKDSTERRKEYKERAREFEANRREVAAVAQEERRQREMDLVLGTSSAQALPGLHDEFQWPPKSREPTIEYRNPGKEKYVPRLSSNSLKMSVEENLYAASGQGYSESQSDESSEVPSPGVPVVRRHVHTSGARNDDSADGSGNNSNSSLFDLSGVVINATEFLDKPPLPPSVKTVSPAATSLPAPTSTRRVKSAGSQRSVGKTPWELRQKDNMKAEQVMSAEDAKEKAERLLKGRQALLEQTARREAARLNEINKKKSAEKQRADRLSALKEHAKEQRRRGTPAEALKRMQMYKDARARALRKQRGLESDDESWADEDHPEDRELPELLQSANQRLNAQTSLIVAADGDDVTEGSQKMMSKLRKNDLKMSTMNKEASSTKSAATVQATSDDEVAATILLPPRKSGPTSDNAEEEVSMGFSESTALLKEAQVRLNNKDMPPVAIFKQKNNVASPRKTPPAKVRALPPSTTSSKSSGGKSRKVQSSTGSPKRAAKVRKKPVVRQVSFGPPEEALRAVAKVAKGTSPAGKRVVPIIARKTQLASASAVDEEGENEVFDLLNTSEIIGRALPSVKSAGRSTIKAKRDMRKSPPKPVPVQSTARSPSEEVAARAARLAASRVRYSGLRMMPVPASIRNSIGCGSPRSVGSSPRNVGVSSPRSSQGSPDNASFPPNPPSPDQTAMQQATAQAAIQKLTQDFASFQDELGHRVQEGVEVRRATDMTDIEQVKAQLAARLSNNLLARRGAQRQLEEEEELLRTALVPPAKPSPAKATVTASPPALSSLQSNAAAQILSPSADVKSVAAAISGLEYAEDDCVSEDLSIAPSENSDAIQNSPEIERQQAPISHLQDFVEDAELYHRQAIASDRIAFSTRLVEIESDMGFDNSYDEGNIDLRLQEVTKGMRSGGAHELAAKLAAEGRRNLHAPPLFQQEEDEAKTQQKLLGLELKVPQGGAKTWFKVMGKSKEELESNEREERAAALAAQAAMNVPLRDPQEAIKTILAARYSHNGDFQTYEVDSDTDDEDGEEYKRILLKSQPMADGDAALVMNRVGGAPDESDESEDENNMINVFAKEILRQKLQEKEDMEAKHTKSLLDMMSAAGSNTTTEQDKENLQNEQIPLDRSSYVAGRLVSGGTGHEKLPDESNAKNFWDTVTTRSPYDRRYNDASPWGDSEEESEGENEDVDLSSPVNLPLKAHEVLRSLDNRRANTMTDASVAGSGPSSQRFVLNNATEKQTAVGTRIASLDLDSLENTLSAAYKPEVWLRKQKTAEALVAAAKLSGAVITAEVAAKAALEKGTRQVLEHQVQELQSAAATRKLEDWETKKLTDARDELARTIKVETALPLSPERVVRQTDRLTPSELRDKMNEEMLRQEQLQDYAIELSELEQAFALATAQEIVKELNQRSESETQALRQEQELHLRQQAYELSLTTAVSSIQLTWQQETAAYEQRVRDLERDVQERETRLQTLARHPKTVTHEASPDAAELASALSRGAAAGTAATSSVRADPHTKSRVLKATHQPSHIHPADDEDNYSGRFEKELSRRSSPSRSPRASAAVDISTNSMTSVRSMRSVTSADDAEEVEDAVSMGDMSASVAMSIQESFALGASSVVEVHESIRLTPARSVNRTSTEEYSDVFDEFYSDDDETAEDADDDSDSSFHRHRSASPPARKSSSARTSKSALRGSHDSAGSGDSEHVQFTDAHTSLRGTTKSVSTNTEKLLIEYRQEMEKRLRSAEKALRIKIDIVKAHRDQRLAEVTSKRTSCTSKTHLAALDAEVRAANAEYAASRAEFDREKWNMNARAYKELRRYNAFRIQVGISAGLSRGKDTDSGAKESIAKAASVSATPPEVVAKSALVPAREDLDVSTDSFIPEVAEASRLPTLQNSTSTTEYDANDENNMSQSSFSVSVSASAPSQYVSTRQGLPIVVPDRSPESGSRRPARNASPDSADHRTPTKLEVQSTKPISSPNMGRRALTHLQIPEPVVLSAESSPKIQTSAPSSVAKAPMSPSSPRLSAEQEARLAAIKEAMLQGRDDMAVITAAMDAEELAAHDDSWDSEVDGGKVVHTAQRIPAHGQRALTTFNYYAQTILGSATGSGRSVLVQEVAAIVIQSAVRRMLVVRQLFPREERLLITSQTGRMPLILAGNLVSDTIRAQVAEEEVEANSFCSNESADAYDSEDQDGQLSYALELALQELASEKRNRETMERVRLQQQEALVKRQQEKLAALEAQAALQQHTLELEQERNHEEVQHKLDSWNSEQIPTVKSSAQDMAAKIDRRLTKSKEAIRILEEHSSGAENSAKTGRPRRPALQAAIDKAVVSPQSSPMHKATTPSHVVTSTSPKRPKSPKSNEKLPSSPQSIDVSKSSPSYSTRASPLVSPQQVVLRSNLASLSFLSHGESNSEFEVGTSSSSDSSVEVFAAELSASFSTPAHLDVLVDHVETSPQRSPTKMVGTSQGLALEAEVMTGSSESDNSTSSDSVAAKVSPQVSPHVSPHSSPKTSPAESPVDSPAVRYGKRSPDAHETNARSPSVSVEKEDVVSNASLSSSSSSEARVETDESFKLDALAAEVPYEKSHNQEESDAEISDSFAPSDSVRTERTDESSVPISHGDVSLGYEVNDTSVSEPVYSTPSPPISSPLSPGSAPPSNTSPQAQRGSPHRQVHITGSPMSPPQVPPVSNETSELASLTMPSVTSHKSGSPQAALASPVRPSGPSSPNRSPSAPSSPLTPHAVVFKPRRSLSPGSDEAMPQSVLHVDSNAVMLGTEPRLEMSPLSAVSSTPVSPLVAPHMPSVSDSSKNTEESIVEEDLYNASGSFLSESITGESADSGKETNAHAKDSQLRVSTELSFATDPDPVTETSDINASLDAISNDGISFSGPETNAAVLSSSDIDASASTVNVHVRIDAATKTGVATFVSPVKERPEGEEEDYVEKQDGSRSQLSVDASASVVNDELDESIATSQSASGILDASDLRALETGPEANEVDSSISIGSPEASPGRKQSEMVDQAPLLPEVEPKTPSFLSDLPSLSMTRKVETEVAADEALDLDNLYDFDEERAVSTNSVAKQAGPSTPDSSPVHVLPPMPAVPLPWGNTIDDITDSLLSSSVAESTIETYANRSGTTSSDAELSTVFTNVASSFAVSQDMQANNVTVSAPMVRAVHDRMTEILHQVSPLDHMALPSSVGRAFNSSLSASLVISAGIQHSGPERAAAVRALVRHHLAEQSAVSRAIQDGSRPFLDFVDVPFLDSFQEGVALAMEHSAGAIADAILEQALIAAVVEYEQVLRK